MAIDGPVVDADAHYWEPIGSFAEYLEEPWKSRISDRNDPGGLLPRSTGDRFMAGRIKREEVSYPAEDMTPDQIPGVMAHVGVDDIVLLPNKMLTFGKLAGEDERPVVLANGYVDYMLDRVVDPSEGIYTMIVAPYQDPEAAVDLIDRVGDERGIVGVCMITAGPEPPLGNRKYDPIYAAAEAKGLPVVFHSGGSSLDDFFVRGYEKFIETHTLGFLWSNMAQLTSIVVQGVPEKFPDLDIAFQESGLFWVPTMMHRLDTEYLKRQSEAPLLEKRPSAYMREFYYGTQPLEMPEDESRLQQVIEDVGGPDQLMYASDYPHWDYDRPSAITDREFLTDDEKARILGGTATEVFGL
jgi:predicted TIM-barrel fold metal-dependent hydrolase